MAGGWDRERLVALDKAHLLHPHVKLADHEATGGAVIVEADGAVLRDADGKEYIDGLAGLWLANAGYSREEIARAAYEQMKTLSYATLFWGWSNPPAIELAARVAELTPAGLNHVYFTSGGSEANETSLKLARLYHYARGKPEKTAFIAFRRAYHGLTYGAMSATGLENLWQGYGELLPGFGRIDPPYGYRCAHGKDRCDASCADALEAEILRIGPEKVAAFIAEPVMGVGGVIVPPPGYYERVRAICDKYDVLWIADEVICGFGRLGTWFGVQHWNAVADLMSVAKGITSGYAPLGASILHDRVYEGLKAGGVTLTHGLTYSGHPVACAVGLKNLEIMEREGLVERSARLGRYLLEKLRTLDHPNIGEVRGVGLMAAVELVADRATRALPEPVTIGFDVQNRARAAGVIVRGLVPGNIVAMSPPLVVTEAQIHRMVEVVGDAVAAAFKAAEGA